MADPIDYSKLAAQYPTIAKMGGFNTQPISDGPAEPVPAWKTGVRQALEGAAHPQTAGDIASLLLPAGAAEALAPLRRLVGGAKAIDTAVPLVTKAPAPAFRALDELNTPGAQRYMETQYAKNKDIGRDILGPQVMSRQERIDAAMAKYHASTPSYPDPRDPPVMDNPLAGAKLDHEMLIRMFQDRVK